MVLIRTVATSSQSEATFDISICFDENGRKVQVRNPNFPFMYPPSMQLRTARFVKSSLAPSQVKIQVHRLQGLQIPPGSAGCAYKT